MHRHLATLRCHGVADALYNGQVAYIVCKESDYALKHHYVCDFSTCHHVFQYDRVIQSCEILP